MTKEEKIKEAYGENYNPHNIDENGWMKYSLWMHFFKKVDADYDEFDNRNMVVRPNSLTGIENNNGWIKIESEDDLPKESSNYWIFQSDLRTVTMKDFYDNKKYYGVKATHYRPIVKPKPPIY